MTAAILHTLSIGTTSVCVLMLILWLIHLPLRNAAIVDAGWAGGLALLGVIYAATGDGYPVRALLIAAMAALWGLRLAILLLFTRVIGHPEEGRYVQLRREWGGNRPLKFLLFFQFQALLCILRSKGDDYRRYQQTTSAFVPWFPRS
jgi:steroid 5-alpha reductase family enzyme